MNVCANKRYIGSTESSMISGFYSMYFVVRTSFALEMAPVSACALRCHPGHASHPSSSGRHDGLAPGAASVWLRPHRFPSAARQQVHLEEGVSGRDGEVTRKRKDSTMNE